MKHVILGYLLVFICVLIVIFGVVKVGSSFSFIGNPQKINCYSGGRLVFSDELSVLWDSYGTDSVYYRSDVTNKNVRVFMDCVVVEK